MHFLFEFLLQPVLELLCYGVGYATALVVVPVFTFGRVTVEPRAGIKLLDRKRGRIQRSARGGYIMEAGLAVLVGVLFWIVVAVVAYFLAQA